ncbi:copper chaperone [Mariprofundus micogutta]|uniref:Copper chaperone n=1 Tax=Mariprofundus micogutta TaxID=1921010 RepID=A0A1L8CP54_9PROT|nr:heavy metal-associated domain-containing protein [Mariprofundus micogutta]GAV20677.1 copper chaperone [Mariprofundus micogutta]
MRILRAALIIAMLSITPLASLFAEEAANQTAIIQVDGLSCPFCAYGLEKNLKKVSGVKTVKIDMKTGKATVALKPNTQVDDQTLRQAVKKAGFTARDITRQ